MKDYLQKDGNMDYYWRSFALRATSPITYEPIRDALRDDIGRLWKNFDVVLSVTEFIGFQGIKRAKLLVKIL